jgi:hypothetical protein
MRAKRQGRVVEIKNEQGKVVKKLRLHKNTPKNCSEPKRLCIVCFTAIHKNDSNYESKVCKNCTHVQSQSDTPLPT